MSQRFVGEDGRMPAWLQYTEDGKPDVEGDRYGAARLLLAATIPDIDRRTAELETLLRERDALPLLAGVMHFALAFCRAAYGENRDLVLNQLALGYGIEQGEQA